MISLLDFIESWLRYFIIVITNYLPVKVIRDDRGVPFLYRYHLFAFTNDGPGICIHHFVKSDPDRGFHDHPWDNAVSFILCGGYSERIVKTSDKLGNSGEPIYTTHERKRFTFNYLKGNNVFHRVMIDEGKDAWTLFFFQKRSKLWGMISLKGIYKAMSTSIKDQDGGWWYHVIRGLGLNQRLEHDGTVVSTVDSIIIAGSKILLIKRGKDPYKNCWALPGGRIERNDKDILFAAKRELKEETNIQDINLEYVKTVGNSHRDPRGFCLTNIFIGKLPEIPKNVRAGDDAVDYEWFNLDNLPDMAFDHKQIINEIVK
jgi:8-oxo-dGTP diphosphatase